MTKQAELVHAAQLCVYIGDLYTTQTIYVTDTPTLLPGRCEEADARECCTSSANIAYCTDVQHLAARVVGNFDQIY